MPNNERLEPSLELDFKKVSEIPNAPFLYEPARRAIATELKNMGFADLELEPDTNSERQFSQDEFALYARVKKGEPRQKLIITTHLDHPYVVLDGKGGGTPLGSIGSNRLKEQIQKGGIPINVFSKNGDQVAEDVIVSVNTTSSRTQVKTAFQHHYDANSQAIWDLVPLVIHDGKIRMINSDNMASTAIILSLIREISANTFRQPVDVEFVFAYLEEIRQVSTTGTALRGCTPFGQITEDSLIVVLESASMEFPEINKKILSEMRLEEANYDDGVMIRVNDRDIVYGQQFPADNLTENLLLKAAKNAGVHYQHTLVSGTCDALAYSLFSRTPNIGGITIPTRHKHNIGDHGEIVHEEVLVRDVRATRSILLNSVNDCGRNAVPKYHPEAHSRKLKSTTIAASPEKISSLKRDLVATYFSSYQRLKRAKFYPVSLSDRFSFAYSSALGKIVGRLVEK